MTRSSSRRRTAAPAFPALPPGIQIGLRRLVSDNAATVAKMLNKTLDDDDNNKNIETLCEACAGVMKQQQLSAASFLARFFDTTVLSEHAILLQKSGKGSAPTLSERIANEWAKNKGIPEAKKEEEEGATTEAPQKTKRKKAAEKEKDEVKEETPTKKKKKTKSDAGKAKGENDNTPDKKKK